MGGEGGGARKIRVTKRNSAARIFKKQKQKREDKKKKGEKIGPENWREGAARAWGTREILMDSD